MTSNQIEMGGTDLFEAALTDEQKAQAQEVYTADSGEKWALYEAYVEDLPEDVSQVVSALNLGRMRLEDGRAPREDAEKLYNMAAELLPQLVASYPEHVVGVAQKVIELDLTEVSVSRAKHALRHATKLTPEVRELLERDRAKRAEWASEKAEKWNQELTALADTPGVESHEVAEHLHDVVDFTEYNPDLDSAGIRQIEEGVRTLAKKHPEATQEGFRDFLVNNPSVDKIRAEHTLRLAGEAGLDIADLVLTEEPESS